MAEPTSTSLAALRETVPYPSFHPTMMPVRVDDDTLHVRGGVWNGPLIRMHDDDDEGVLGRLADRIDGETHVDDVVGAFPEQHRTEVVGVLAKLVENNAVFDRSRLDDEPAYPHLAVRSRFSDETRRRLDDRRVGVVSVGSLGRHVVEDLTSFGVREIGVVQPVADRRDEALAADDAVTAFGDGDLDAVVAAADLVVYVAGGYYPDLTSAIDERAHETGTPWVSGVVTGQDAVVGPAVFPGETACHTCYENRRLATIDQPRAFEGERLVPAADDLDEATLAPLARAVAGYLGVDLLHLLAFGVGYTVGTVVAIDALDMSIEVNDVLRLPRCDVCGKTAGDDVNRFTTLDDVHEAYRRDGE